MTRKRATHCKRGHERTPANLYGNNECRTCQLARANKRAAARANQCRKCDTKFEMRKRVRQGIEQFYRSCPKCVRGYGYGKGEVSAVRDESSATHHILALTTQLEHAMPWERDEIRAAIARAALRRDARTA